METPINYCFYANEPSAYHDVFDILQTTNRDFIPPISEKHPLHEVAQKYIDKAACIIAYVSDKPAGMVAFYPNEAPKASYLSIICVREEFRGFGIGRELEIKCIDHCRQIGSSRIEVNMRLSNKRLYQSRIDLGWRVIRNYKSEYADEVITDLYMELDA